MTYFNNSELGREIAKALSLALHLLPQPVVKKRPWWKSAGPKRYTNWGDVTPAINALTEALEKKFVSKKEGDDSEYLERLLDNIVREVGDPQNPRHGRETYHDIVNKIDPYLSEFINWQSDRDEEEK